MKEKQCIKNVTMSEIANNICDNVDGSVKVCPEIFSWPDKSIADLYAIDPLAVISAEKICQKVREMNGFNGMILENPPKVKFKDRFIVFRKTNVL